MRITLLDWVGDPARPGASGLSDVVWDLAREWRALGEDVTILGTYDAGARLRPTDARVFRVDVPQLFRRNAIGQVLTCYALWRAIAKLPRTDVVFAPEYVAPGIIGLCDPNVRTTFTTPGNIFERIENGNPFDWVTTQVYKVAAVAAARRATRVIALSQHMREWWMRTGAAPERVPVIPLGIDTSLFAPRPGARHRLGIPANAEIILYGGRFSVEKNLPTLIQAIAALAPTRPRMRLLLVGSGPDEERLRRDVGRLGLDEVVQFVGWVPKSTIVDYYSAADVAVLPSTSEPLARALLEAMACGTVVVASRAGGTPDLIRDEENGLLVPPLDVGAWTAALNRALERSEWRTSMARVAAEETRFQYNWQTVARRMRDEALAPAAAEAPPASKRSTELHNRTTTVASRRLLPVYLLDYVLDVERPGASGLSDIVWDTAVELSRQGVETHVFGPYRKVPRPDTGVTLHTFGIPPPGYRNVIGRAAIVYAGYRAIRALGRVGIIHAPEYLSTGLIAPMASDYPVVMTVPGSIYEKIASDTNPYDRTMTAALRLTARLSARHCACVIATTTDMVRWWLKTGASRRRLVQLPLGVDTVRFVRQPDARRALGIADDRTVLVNVGRLNEENGIATLIESVALASTRVPSIELHLVGAGPELEPLRNLAARLGVADRIVWHGWVDSSRLAGLYSAADLFVFAAYTAGLPRVVLEAMACGAPVLGTKVSGVTDHIIDGVTGYLTPPRTAQGLATVMTEVLSNSTGRAAVAEAGMRHVRDHLSWEAIVRQQIDHVYAPISAARKWG